MTTKYKKERKYIEKECVLLCDALNSIPGIQTLESCSGHKKDPFYIIFNILVIKNMIILLKSMDNRYWENVPSHRGTKNWNVEVVSPEEISRPILFYLNSGSISGPRVYDQANKIAKKIFNFLKNKKFLKKWNIQRSSFQVEMIRNV